MGSGPAAPGLRAGRLVPAKCSRFPPPSPVTTATQFWKSRDRPSLLLPILASGGQPQGILTARRLSRGSFGRVLTYRISSQTRGFLSAVHAGRRVCTSSCCSRQGPGSLQVDHARDSRLSCRRPIPALRERTRSRVLRSRNSASTEAQPRTKCQKEAVTGMPTEPTASGDSPLSAPRRVPYAPGRHSCDIPKRLEHNGIDRGLGDPKHPL